MFDCAKAKIRLKRDKIYQNHTTPRTGRTSYTCNLAKNDERETHPCSSEKSARLSPRDSRAPHVLIMIVKVCFNSLNIPTGITCTRIRHHNQPRSVVISRNWQSQKIVAPQQRWSRETSLRALALGPPPEDKGGDAINGERGREVIEGVESEKGDALPQLLAFLGKVTITNYIASDDGFV